MGNWFHRLFNPHCPHCLLERECRNCDTLREQLSVMTQQNHQLIQRLLPPIEEKTNIESHEPIKPKNVPWAVRRQMLEAEDRAAAATLAKLKEDEDFAKLEKEVIDGR